MTTNIIDARQFRETHITSDICIVGAGAAGITLARELAGEKVSVALIESGGFDIEGETQGLFSGKNLGLEYFNLLSCRLRYFGGTTNHWSGYCRANDPIDYKKRPELDLPGWPVDHADLDPFIKQAGTSLGINHEHFSPNAILEKRGLSVGDLLDDGDLQTKVFQLAQNRRLGPKHLPDLKKQRNLTIYHHLNICNIRLSADAARVQKLDCATINGTKITVNAKYYVVCCHGIENARLLLTSNDVLSYGVGNRGGHVGKYFMDHIHINASKFIPSSKFPFIYDWTYARKHKLNANLSFTDKYHESNRLLQYYCRFRPVFLSKSETHSAIHGVFGNFKEKGDLQYLKDLATTINEPINSAKYVSALLNVKHTYPLYYELDHRLEQCPNPNSKVVISDRKDALGNFIADLDWQISDHDVESFSAGQQTIVKKLSAGGYGRFEVENIDRALVEERVSGHYHQIGTTRMSDSEVDGVVDKDCKVFGVDNLFIGGSSVFPTAGYSGPTMMIIALAIRKARHFKDLIAKGVL